MSTPSDADLPAQRLARLLLSGCIGRELLARLAEEFGGISRGEVFAGVALAWTEREAAMLAAEAETRDLRQQLRAAKAALRPLQRQEAA